MGSSHTRRIPSSFDLLNPTSKQSLFLKLANELWFHLWKLKKEKRIKKQKKKKKKKKKRKTPFVQFSLNHHYISPVVRFLKKKTGIKKRNQKFSILYIPLASQFIKSAFNCLYFTGIALLKVMSELQSTMLIESSRALFVWSLHSSGLLADFLLQFLFPLLLKCSSFLISLFSLHHSLWMPFISWTRLQNAQVSICGSFYYITHSCPAFF